MNAGQTIRVRYEMEKATPGTIRYREVDSHGNPPSSIEEAVAPTLYIRKTALGDSIPQQLEVTITAR